MALTPEQMRNAAIIYKVGRQMGMSSRDIQIALITAMQESSLRNLNHGDRDSLGLFQQRPSQGWGTPEQVTDPVYASRKFYKTLKGLGERRYSMSMTQAAQAVQRSAYPNAYAKHIGLVRSIYPKLANDDGPRPFTTIDGSSPGAQPGDGRRGGGVGNAFDVADSFDVADPNILAADYNPVLAAPQFWIGEEQPAYASPLTPDTFRMVKDKAASNGSFGIGTSGAKGVDGWRAGVVDAAREYLGTPYVWGGTSPKGFDCSGFVQYVYGKLGINLPRVSYAQANSGKRIGLDGLRPGDLVAWDNSSRNNGADHIAIYIGGGRIIEAPRPGLSVRIRKLGGNEGAWGVRISR